MKRSLYLMIFGVIAIVGSYFLMKHELEKPEPDPEPEEEETEEEEKPVEDPQKVENNGSATEITTEKV